MKRVLLCADDFGRSSAVDDAVIALVEAGRLTHVSCRVGTPAWAADAPRLAAAAARHGTACGLHLNLTDGTPLAPALAQRWPVFPGVRKLWLQAKLRLLPLRELRAEIRAQWAAFEPAFGREPTYFDGLQHVHQFPVIRRLVMEFSERRPSMRLRHTGQVEGPGWALRRHRVMLSGGRAMGELLRERHRGLNERMAGVYDFKAEDYRACMQRWLAALPERGGLIVCHPGRAPAEGDPPDPLAAARQREFAYLASDAFAEDLAAAGVELAFPQPPSTAPPVPA